MLGNVCSERSGKACIDILLANSTFLFSSDLTIGEWALQIKGLIPPGQGKFDMLTVEKEFIVTLGSRVSTP